MTAQAAPRMPDVVRRVEADWSALRRKFANPLSLLTEQRMEKFFEEELKAVQQLPFNSYDKEDRIDFLLLQNKLQSEKAELEVAKKRRLETEPLTPFAQGIYVLDDELRQNMSRPEGQASAKALHALLQQVKQATEENKEKALSGAVAMRGVEAVGEAREALGHWYRFYAGYDPEFTWWCERPFQDLDKALEEYAKFLREEKAKLAPNDKTTIIGDPIGREALLADLKSEMIDYSPEELVKIAEREMAWCEAELAKAAKEMGCKDGPEALEKVKNAYVKPGEQPGMIRELALIAIDYFKKHDLLTVPPLAEETWRMEMLSAQAQLQSPFFLGGELIQVSFPTSSMEHEAKMMSLRGNNPHFAWATVHHELIPGHHLQQFYESRWNEHRRLFNTPFWVEGWALYWEMILWDRGFFRGPEDKVGMLFWRMHRCARIIFSLGFHLGTMTPQECIELLVTKVGHERENAVAEVRRSFAGSYPPLYQAAYMLGALQLRELRRELVESGQMKEKAFHDAILEGNRMPIAMVRARLGKGQVSLGERKAWRFYPGL